VKRFFSAIAACAALVAITACATDPVRAARTPLQKTYALMQDYETAQAFALTFVENAQTPDKAKDALIRAEGAATPFLKATADAARAVAAEIKRVQAGESTGEKLQFLTQDMESIALQLIAAKANLIKATNEAKASLKPTSGSIWEPSLVPLEEDEQVVILPTARPANLLMWET